MDSLLQVRIVLRLLLLALSRFLIEKICLAVFVVNERVDSIHRTFDTNMFESKFKKRNLHGSPPGGRLTTSSNMFPKQHHSAHDLPGELFKMMFINNDKECLWDVIWDVLGRMRYCS